MDFGIAIAGTGAVGESLATVLHAAGYNVSCIISRTRHNASQLARSVDAPHALALGDALPGNVKLIFLCVPDDAVTETAEHLAELDNNWGDVCVAHTSGALTSRALEALTVKGATAFSFHPVQTFKKGTISNWEGIYVGIEGDAEGLQVGQHIIDRLAAIPFILSHDDKVMYHASAVFASNFLVTVVGVAAEILAGINTNRSEAITLLKPLVLRTCENIIASAPEHALTGPASRGDIKTIRKHAAALKDHFPEKYPLYLALTREAIKLKVLDNPVFADVAQRMDSEIDALMQGNDG